MQENEITSTPGFSRFSIGGSNNTSVRRRSLISRNGINHGGKEVNNIGVSYIKILILQKFISNRFDLDSYVKIYYPWQLQFQ